MMSNEAAILFVSNLRFFLYASQLRAYGPMVSLKIDEKVTWLVDSLMLLLDLYNTSGLWKFADLRSWPLCRRCLLLLFFDFCFVFVFLLILADSSLIGFHVTDW